MKTYQYYAACPKGLEGLLLEELTSLNVESPRETIGGVHFSGDLTTAYRCCLWSRLANKILLPLANIEFTNDQELYDAVLDIPWEDHLAEEGNFKVDFIGTNDIIRNSQFGAVRIKDGIVDRFRQRTNHRPSVQKDSPDLLFNARLVKAGTVRNRSSKDSIHISIDLSGPSLHRRGYRTKQGLAPLKENLAAAILLRAQWPAIAKEENCGLIDPMCGSATILIEGMLMAADIAPGLFRQKWGFSRWLKFDVNDFQPLFDEALARKEAGLIALDEKGIECRGYDDDWHVLRAAESNIALAGLSAFIRVSQKGVDDLKQPSHTKIATGLVICNPPYGERLGEEQELLPVYRQLGHALKTEFADWKAAVFTGNIRLAKNMGIRARKIYKFFNGTLPAELLCFDINEKSVVKQSTLDKDDSRQPQGGSSDNNASEGGEGSTPKTFESLTPGAQMVCNRLKKNKKGLRKWLAKNEVTCYRLYDADMPEYSAAIDCYGDFIHVQEYKAPKTIDEKSAQYRFDELISAIPIALDINEANIFVKQRQRNKGKLQYERLAHEENRAKIAVQEGQATLLIDLWSYLDSGLFLDHRPVRQMITQMVTGKSFLNLFCYTATATVHAALAGAESSTSVDMSNTYLDWAEENFSANHLNSNRHDLVQKDCIKWLEECREGFDVILLDPPSFSNSKRMDDVLDIQKDHAAMIDRCMDLLNHGGVLIFSTNLRSFRLDKEVGNTYCVDNITDKTLDPDFQRNRRIHQCYLIRA
ncbi:MAG: 23S rRNA (guanine2445-N2)-methyltransferase / 23S rRNA (guanine2069-N7)-methyltransferase [Candidatus Endobugula sp.]|jgi:23S rRNA (guanine2445-N2)-methyltransferase / 23S rRNA (guanine2069-N7)-methyltransferase